MHNWTQCTPTWSRLEPIFLNEHRCYFPVAGEATMGHNSETWRMTPGQVYLIPGQRAHWHRCEAQFDLHWLHFRLDTLAVEAQLARQPTMFAWPQARWAHWQPTWRQLSQPSPQWPTALRCQVHAMVLDLLADALAQLEHTQPVAPDPLLIRRLEPAIAFMDAHFRANPCLDDVAASVHLSPVYFHQKFTAAFGQSPHLYMLRRRMHLARTLLMTTSDAVGQVGSQVGYDNPYYFSRVFRRHFGISPQNARKQWRHNAP